MTRIQHLLIAVGCASMDAHVLHRSAGLMLMGPTGRVENTNVLSSSIPAQPPRVVRRARAVQAVEAYPDGSFGGDGEDDTISQLIPEHPDGHFGGDGDLKELAGQQSSYPTEIGNFPMPIPTLCKPKFPGAATEKLGAQPKNRNVAVLLHGEAFRSGNRGSREICQSPDSKVWQQAIAENHMRMLISPLKKNGHEVHVFLSTYKCPAPNSHWDLEFPSWYGDVLKNNWFESQAVGQSQATTYVGAFDLLQKYAIDNNLTYEGGVLLLRNDFLFLKPFTEFEAYPQMQHKLLMNGWGGGDVFFGVPWYFMNCFAGVFESNCFKNKFQWGWPCWQGVHANLVDEGAQVVDPFRGADAACTPTCPAEPSYVIHPWSCDNKICCEKTCAWVQAHSKAIPSYCHMPERCSNLPGVGV